MSALNAKLLALPQNLVAQRRRLLFETVVPGLGLKGASVLMDPDFDLTAARARLAEALLSLAPAAPPVLAASA
jgi:hypothetical protein